MLKSDPQSDFGFVGVVFIVYRFCNYIVLRVEVVDIFIKTGGVFVEFINLSGVAIKSTQVQSEATGNSLNFSGISILVGGIPVSITRAKAEDAVYPVFCSNPDIIGIFQQCSDVFICFSGLVVIETVVTIAETGRSIVVEFIIDA